jgi:hypothetical protein
MKNIVILTGHDERSFTNRLVEKQIAAQTHP